MAVHGLHKESESGELLVDRIGAHNVAHGAVDLKIVVVNEHEQVIQLIVRGEHHRFPDLAFLDLAVAEERIYAHAVSKTLCAERHARRRGYALAERAGGHVHAGREIHIGMALQTAADMAERLELVHGEKAAVGEHRVERRSRMALGEHKAVALFPARILRIDIHVLEIEIGEHIGGGKASARMPGFCRVNALDDAEAHFAGGDLQLFLFVLRQSIRTSPAGYPAKVF